MGAGSLSQRDSRRRVDVRSGGGSPAGSPTGPPTPLLAPSCRVGVVAALPDEARCLASARAPFGTPVLVDQNVLLCISGIGVTAARDASEALIAAGAGALVSWGVAAGLSAGATVGTVVLGDLVVDLSSPSSERFELLSSPSWTDRLIAKLPSAIKVMRGPIASTDRVLCSVADKRAAGVTGAVAADMETAAVAKVAHQAGVPWVAIRAVSDAADEVLPLSAIQAFDAAGRVRLSRLIAGFAHHPADLLQLPRVARGFSTALRSLRIVSAAVGPQLLATGSDAAPLSARTAQTPAIGFGP